MGENNTMLVCEVEGAIQGFAELREGRHLVMLFVHPLRQRSGIGRGLVAWVLKHCTGDAVTVRASLSSVGAYLNYGFQLDGAESESHGLRFQPMRKQLR